MSIPTNIPTICQRNFGIIRPIFTEPRFCVFTYWPQMGVVSYFDVSEMIRYIKAVFMFIENMVKHAVLFIILCIPDDMVSKYPQPIIPYNPWNTLTFWMNKRKLKRINLFFQIEEFNRIVQWVFVIKWGVKVALYKTSLKCVSKLPMVLAMTK